MRNSAEELDGVGQDDVFHHAERERVGHSGNVIGDDGVNPGRVFAVNVFHGFHIIGESACGLFAFFGVRVIIKTVTAENDPEVVKQVADAFIDGFFALAHLFVVVNALVIKRAQLGNQFELVIREADAVPVFGVVNQVQREGVDDFPVGRADFFAYALGNIRGGNQVGLDGVLNVASQIGDFVRQAHNTPFIRGRHLAAPGDFFQIVRFVGGTELVVGEVFAAVADDAVFDGERQIQAFTVVGQVFHYAVTVEFVQKAVGAQARVDGAFAFVAERRMADVVPEADGVGHILAEFPIPAFVKAPADGGRDGGHMQYVLDAGADMVVIGSKEHLCFVL